MRIAILTYEHAVPTCVTGPADIWNGMSRMYPLLSGTPMKKPIQVDFVSASGRVLLATPNGAQKPKKNQTKRSRTEVTKGGMSSPRLVTA